MAGTETIWELHTLSVIYSCHNKTQSNTRNPCKQEQFLRVHAHAPEAYLENIQVPCIYSSDRVFQYFDLAATTHAAMLSAECKSKNV